MTRSYPNPRAFKDALEARVKRTARSRGIQINRQRQLLLFERFLARVYDALEGAVLLKGGLVLELRLARARTTRDIDLRVEGDLEELIGEIRATANQSEADYLSFEIQDEEHTTELAGEQIVYEGRRLHIRARLAGKDYGSPFHLDVSTADRVVAQPDMVPGTDLLEFVGIDAVEHRVYPEETHVAEKLHAISQRYDKGPNSRAKDLVDIGLLADHSRFEAGTLRRSIEATFEFRDTHPIPSDLPEPPELWNELYENMREDDRLRWANLDELHNFCGKFLGPVLDGEKVEQEQWHPGARKWESRKQ